MKIKTIMLGGAAFAMSATAALAEDMTIVSWGGAYTASRLRLRKLGEIVTLERECY